MHALLDCRPALAAIAAALIGLAPCAVAQSDADAAGAPALAAFAKSLDVNALPCAAAAQAPTQDLRRLIVSALCRRQLASLQKAEIDARRALVAESRATYYPVGQFGLGRSANQSRYLGELGFTDRLSRSTAALTLSWRLFDFGARTRRVEAGRRDEEAAIHNAEYAVLGFVRQWVEAFHEHQSLGCSIAARELETPTLTRLVAAHDALAARVLPASADAQSPRLRLVAHLAQLDADRARLARATASMATLSGVSVTSIPPCAATAAASPPPDIDLQAWLAQATGAHPAIAALRSARDAAALRLDESVRARYPAVDLTAGRYLNRSSSAAVLGGRAVIDEMGLQLSWTFFDGFGGASRSRSLEAGVAKASHQMLDALDEVTASVCADHAELLAMRDARVSALARQASARNAQDLTHRKLKAGQSTLIDVLEAALTLSIAERELRALDIGLSLAWHRLALDAGSFETVESHPLPGN